MRKIVVCLVAIIAIKFFLELSEKTEEDRVVCSCGCGRDLPKHQMIDVTPPGTDIRPEFITPICYQELYDD